MNEWCKEREPTTHKQILKHHVHNHAGSNMCLSFAIMAEIMNPVDTYVHSERCAACSMSCWC